MKTLLVSLNAKYIHSSLALRYIKEYCNEYKNDINMLEFTINQSDDYIVKKIYQQQPDVIGFSCYIWNMSMLKTLIPTLKKILPNTTFILGGPEVSYQSEALHHELGVDIIMMGEGEKTWKDYLDYRNGKIQSIQEVEGISYITQEGKININPQKSLLDLKELPFVYEDFEGLEHRIIYYEASRGCPFNCQYCLSSVEKGVRFMPIERVTKELQYFLDHKVPQVKFVDRTFNAKKTYAMQIWQYLIDHDNGFTNFHFEIAAELITGDMLTLLKEARDGLIQFEIGVQSTNLDVLTAIDRKMPFEDIKAITNKIKALGNIHQHLDLIAGLPLEDYQSFRNSFNDVISLRPEQFQLGFLKVLKGSGLRVNAKQYGIVYRDEPPYEVLYTKAISYEEILKLHLIEEMLERYYNSERFNSVLEYLYTAFETPFDCFEALAVKWEREGYADYSHKKAFFYTFLIEFASEVKALNLEFVKELVRFEWYKHEYVKAMPASLQTINQESFKSEKIELLKQDELIGAYVENVEKMSMKQRTNKFYIEKFKYSVLVNNEPILQSCKILFYYAQKGGSAEYRVLEKE